MSKAKDAKDAAREYVRNARRDWHETPPITKRDEQKLDSSKKGK